MPVNRILALSSSRAGDGGYLETAIPVIKDFLTGNPLNIAFVPFASVANNYNEYGSMVKNAFASLPFLITIVTPAHAKEIIERSDIIMVGGGNTFKLLHDLYHLRLLDIIRDKVNSGAPYIGWSAGSNITCPTIGTTNDMPVIQPKSFNALGLLPFQINPHYTNAKPTGHHGETRDHRLEEFILLNPGVFVVGLPEGTALKLDNGVLSYIGAVPARLFYGDGARGHRKEINEEDDLSFLL